MTKEQIQKALDDIGAENGDNEYMHRMEDQLYEDFVRSIAEDPTLPLIIQEKAKSVLTSKDMKFDRWYA